MKIAEYRAECLRRRLNDKNYQYKEDEDLVLDVIKMHQDKMKTEDIVKEIEKITDLDTEDARGLVACALKNLKKKDVVEHVSYGFWKVK